MSWFKKIKTEISYNRTYNTVEWKKLKIAIIFLSAVLIYVGYSRYRDVGPWYLGCATRDGKELLLKTDKKPYIKGGFVFLEDDIFVIPEPLMTCRIVTVSKAEEEQALNK